MKPTKEIKKRLEELRAEIRKECISYGELAELQSLAEYIDPADVELLEWAGVTEFPEEDIRRCHLCDSIMDHKYCTNTTCAEYE